MNITRKEVRARIISTLTDEDGAGSDLTTEPSCGLGCEFLPVNGYLDLDHLTSDIVAMILDAGGAIEPERTEPDHDQK